MKMEASGKWGPVRTFLPEDSFQIPFINVIFISQSHCKNVCRRFILFGAVHSGTYMQIFVLFPSITIFT